jgi:hypothetical protein
VAILDTKGFVIPDFAFPPGPRPRRNIDLTHRATFQGFHWSPQYGSIKKDFWKTFLDLALEACFENMQKPSKRFQRVACVRHFSASVSFHNLCVFGERLRAKDVGPTISLFDNAAVGVPSPSLYANMS